MVGNLEADLFVYDGLCEEGVRKNLLARKVKSREAVVGDYQLGLIDHQDRSTLIPGPGAVVGEIFTVSYGELELIRRFMNRREGGQRLRYNRVLLNVRVFGDSTSDDENSMTEALSLISRRTLPVDGFFAPVTFQEHQVDRAMCRAAKQFRAQYLATLERAAT